MKLYFITFGAGIFTNQIIRLSEQVRKTNWFDEVIAENPESISSFINEHKEFIENNRRGFGYWIWKPYIIQRQLSKMNDGDILFYADAGAYILPHRKNIFDEYIKILQSSDKPFMVFDPNFMKEKEFQKSKVLKRFNLQDNQEFLNSTQIESGVFGLMKTDFTVMFINEWLNYALEDNHSLFTDSTEKESVDFKDHRHDQSILSIISKLYDVHIIKRDDCYGVGPFFSQRMTDKGPREFSPDWFRREPDYIFEKHKKIEDWLADKTTDDWFKEHEMYDPKIHHTCKDFTFSMWEKFSKYDYVNPNERNI